MDKRAEISETTGDTTTNGGGKKLVQYFLNRLRESTTWIGILVSALEIPKRIEDPLTQAVLAVLSIAMILVKEGSTDQKNPASGSSASDESKP